MGRKNSHLPIMEMKIGNGEGVSALKTRVHGALFVHGST